MENQKEKTKHEIRLDSRKHLEIFGVSDVASFDQENVIVYTSCGGLNIDGKELKVSVLDTESGRVVLDGMIDAIYYSDDKSGEKQGFFGRLLK